MQLESLDTHCGVVTFDLKPTRAGFYGVTVRCDGREVYVVSDGYHPVNPRADWRECIVDFACYDAERGVIPAEHAAFWRTHGEAIQCYLLPEED